MMTNKEVLTVWHDDYLPAIHDQFEKDYQVDSPARNETFNNFTDMLCKENQISDEQYNNICLPDCYDNDFHPNLNDALIEMED